MKRWGVYLLRCADGTLYCGATNDIGKRLVAHNAGRGAKYTRGRRPVRLVVFTENTLSRADALRLERAVKRLPRAKKAPHLRAIRQRRNSHS